MKNWREYMNEPEEEFVHEEENICGWQDLPRQSQRWVVDGWVPHGTTSMFAGAGGIGKTTAMLQMAIAVATGGSWMGIPTEQGRVVLVLCEDNVHIHQKRMADIADHEGIRLDDYADMISLNCMNGRNMNLLRYEDERVYPRPAFNWLKDRVKGASLVIIDALHNVSLGNENDRAYVQLFITSLNGLGPAVLFASHPSRAGMATDTGDSGSTGWAAGVRSHFYMKRLRDDEDDRSDRRIVRHFKSNYGPLQDDLVISFSGHGFLRDGGPDTGTVARLDKAAQETKAMEVLLRGLRKLIDVGKFTSSVPGRNYLPAVMREADLLDGVSMKVLRATVTRAIVERLIEEEEYKDANYRAKVRLKITNKGYATLNQ